MSGQDFTNLLQLVKLEIMNSDTKCRWTIVAIERLAITLRFLATRYFHTSLMYSFKISKLVPIVCDTIIGVLGDNKNNDK